MSEEPEKGVILYRLLDNYGITGLLKRLEYSDVGVYDFSDESDNIKENVWSNTEFLCVLTHRFGIILIWENKVESPGYVRFYSVVNSKLQNLALDIIGRNTKKVPIKDFQESFNPDRRDNNLMNKSVRRLIQYLDEASTDAILGFAETQCKKEKNDMDDNTRIIAHEIRNSLAVCDLYSEIIKKYCAKNEIADENILNALKTIKRAAKLGENNLIGLKATQKLDIKPHKLKDLIKNSYNLTKVYLEDKNIEYKVKNSLDVKISVDDNKFLSVIMNIVKNASEAFEKNDLDGKYIKILTEDDGDYIQVRISNNAGKIKEPSKIFNENYTTKEKGSGLGLSICKKTIESMFGRLVLEHNEDDYVEFVIRMAKVNKSM